MQNNVVWSSVKVPQWPFLYLFGFSYAVAALVVIMTIIRKIIALAQGKAEEEARLGSIDVEFAFGKYKMSMIPAEAFMKQAEGDTPEKQPDSENKDTEKEEVNNQ